MLTVTVDDRPLDVAAIVERGRVLVPLRATFSALGASVGYDSRNRVIVARNAFHALRLPIGSQTALVDARPVHLDVPAQVIASRTYVPLRFVAQAMGASVGYDGRAQLVTVSSQQPQRTSAVGVAAVIALSPPANGDVSTAYPTVSASLGTQNAARSDVVLLVDGQDVTALATFDGSTITYLPRTALARGRHTVSFSGRTSARTRFSAHWSFFTTLSPPPEDLTPAFSAFDYRLYANGSAFYSGQWMHFTLVAPPGGSARLQLCGMGFDYPLRYGGYGDRYEADIPAPAGYWIPSCPVVAVYTSWNGVRTYVPVPLTIGLYTLTKRDAATPAPRRIEPQPRRTEPTPSPAPRPTASRRLRALGDPAP